MQNRKLCLLVLREHIENAPHFGDHRQLLERTGRIRYPGQGVGQDDAEHARAVAGIEKLVFPDHRFSPPRLQVKHVEVEGDISRSLNRERPCQQSRDEDEHGPCRA